MSYEHMTKDELAMAAAHNRVARELINRKILNIEYLLNKSESFKIQSDHDYFSFELNADKDFEWCYDFKLILERIRVDLMNQLAYFDDEKSELERRVSE